MVSDEIARNMDAVRQIATEVLRGSEESVVQAERLHELAFELEESIGGFNLDGSKLGRRAPAARRRAGPRGAAVAGARAPASGRRPGRPARRPTRTTGAATDAWRSRLTSSPASRAGSPSTPGSSCRRGSSRRATTARIAALARHARGVRRADRDAARRRASSASSSRRCASARRSLFRHRPADRGARRRRGARRCARAASATIRVWSAGCAAGEEPYTLAAVLVARPARRADLDRRDRRQRRRARGRARRATYPRARARRRPRRVARRVRRRRRSRARPARARAARPVRAREPVDAVAAARLRRRVVPQRADLLHGRGAPPRDRAPDRGDACPAASCSSATASRCATSPELDAQRAGEAVFYVRRGAREPPAPPTSRRRAAADAAGRRRRSRRVAPPPPPGLPRRPRRADEAVLRARAAAPTRRALTTSIGEQLAATGLRRLTIDLDGAELLGDDLAPVLRRRARPARAAGIERRCCARPAPGRGAGCRAIGLDEGPR